MPTEQEIIERLTDVCSEFQTGEYDEWASQAIPVYQEILDDAGLVVFAVVAGQPNGNYVDEIILRAPWGEETTFPDPEEIDEDSKTAYTTKYVVEREADERTHEMEAHCYIQQLVTFFMELVAKVKTLDPIENLGEAKVLIGMAMIAQKQYRFDTRDEDLRKALLHISIAMRAEPEPTT